MGGVIGGGRCVPQALRTAGGRIVIFRPEMNAARMASGAAKMLMPAPSEELFLRAVQEVVRSNQALSRPHLQPRPLLPYTCRFSTRSSLHLSVSGRVASAGTALPTRISSNASTLALRSPVMTNAPPLGRPRWG